MSTTNTEQAIGDGEDLERHDGQEPEGQGEATQATQDQEPQADPRIAALEAQIAEMREMVSRSQQPQQAQSQPDADDLDVDALEDLRFSDPKAYYRKLREMAVSQVRNEMAADIRDIRSQSVVETIAQSGGDAEYARAIIAQTDPSVLKNPAAVEMIRLASIGKAAEGGKGVYRREPVAGGRIDRGGSDVRADVARMAQYLDPHVAAALLEEYKR